jgi:SMC interacting uncharacterized protein involved in chromosome segregation
MTFTIGDIITAILAIGAIYTAVSNGRKIRAETTLALASTKKTNAEAETASASAVNQYAEAASRMADETSKYQGRMVHLEQRLDVLADLIGLREEEIKSLRDQVRELTEQLSKKDLRIVDLERLTKEQETELTSLRAEVEALRQKQG